MDLNLTMCRMSTRCSTKLGKYKSCAQNFTEAKITQFWEGCVVEKKEPWLGEIKNKRMFVVQAVLQGD